MVTRRKLVAVGDYCGKTHVIRTYLFDEIPEPQVTIVQWDITDVEVNGKTVEVHVWDTCSNERFTPLRVNSYKGANVFAVFFSIYSPQTFENVKNVWVPEIRKYGPKEAPIVLVGTHCRKHTMKLGDIITKEQGDAMAKDIGAADYIECSVENKFSVEEMFVKAISATL